MTLLRCLMMLTTSFSLVVGHGNMVYPYVWMDKHQVGAWQEGHVGGGIGCGSIPEPDDQQHVESPKIGCLGNWFTNDTKIPHSSGKRASVDHHNPWFAPGTAPIYSPCGLAGGNPMGCTGQDNEKFGDCCGGKCGGYSFGRKAEDYDWPNAPVTEWKAGSYQEVSWYSNANHLGGYVYRLCKMPEQGLGVLTEECFQEGSLEFEGDKLWFIAQHEDVRQELNATRVIDGTFPAGSQWTEVPIAEKGQIIDYVKVPADLERGLYVLSFRWYCKKTPQVWNICANINIV